MSAHVDDFFWSGTAKFKSSVITQLTKTFNICSENQETFKYLGIQVNQLNEQIIINQKAYEDTIEFVELEGDRNTFRAVTKKEQGDI